MTRSICIYVEEDDQSGDFHQEKDPLILENETLTDLCENCEFRAECMVAGSTSYRYFSTNKTTKHVKWSQP
jgi:hypothetical protein